MNSSIRDRSSDPVGAETLDDISEANAFNKWMYSAISANLKGSILEIGSGIGNISEYVLKDKNEVTLSDLRQEYCDYLSERFINSKSFAGVERIDLAEKKFEERYSNLLNRFDTVFALNVIEHIENDSHAIQNCRKLLKEGGTLILLVPSYKWLYCKFDKELGHFRRYDRKNISGLVRSNGFELNTMFNFNAAGVVGWFVFGKLMKNKQIKREQMKLFNYFVVLFILIDKVLFHKFGLSLIITARKSIYGTDTFNHNSGI